MKRLHVPQVNTRYWIAITLASIFGTNLGDFYAHESGLGIVKGLGVLATLSALVFLVEHFESRRHQVYYWLVIILIRTGATNIADYLAFRVRVPPIPLIVGLVTLFCLFAWGTRRTSTQPDDRSSQSLLNTNAAYWLAMLAAGVLGTVVGDRCSMAMGENLSALSLGVLLMAVLILGRGYAVRLVAAYWATVAVARTSGTAIGDWLAESPIVHIGLPLCTILTGTTFLAVLLFWPSSRPVSDHS